jgi:hypothetical protein
MRAPTWSHSSLKDFEGCERRYQHTRVLKLYPFKETAATRYGNDVHAAIEHYIRDGVPLDPMYEKFKPIVDAMLSKPGRKLAEQRMAVTEQLVPCAWDSPAVWVRGIADILIIDDENMTAWVGDWKTGNNRYPDLDQLVLMSLMVFCNYPHIRRVNSALFFILKNDMVKMKMLREDMHKGWQRYRERYARLVASYANNRWNPNQTPLCGWCPVTGCEFNPKHHGG